MSHFLTVPINTNGIITDAHIDTEIASAVAPPFSFTDVFIYSHGWWTTASTAMGDYNDFSVGFAKTLQNVMAMNPSPLKRIGANFSALSIGLHWPSTISEDQDSVANFAEATSFFTMEHRADAVGEHAAYALLRLLIDGRKGRPPLRFHILGHSFGCRVVCSALQALTQDPATLKLAGDEQAEFNVVLLQAASDCDSLAPTRLYGNVLQKIPRLRLLVSVSDNDSALGTWYPKAQKLAHLFSDPIEAMGAAGPQGNLVRAVSQRIDISRGKVPTPEGDFVVANLTPLHQAHAADYAAQGGGGWGGQHSDIYLDEIYELLARFLGN